MSKKPTTTTAQKAADTQKPKRSKLALKKETLKDMTAPDAGRVKGGFRSAGCCA